MADPVPPPDAASRIQDRSRARGGLGLALVLLTARFAAVSAQAPELPCPGNLLVNPGFEAGFSARGFASQTLALGWLAWQAPGPSDPALSPAARFRDGEAAALAGAWSQKVEGLGPLQAGGLWQAVPVPSGERVLAQAWARAWQGSDADRLRSRSNGAYALGIGLDPRGGSDPDAAGIVWTTPVTVTDGWLPLFVSTTAETGAVSLFLRGQPLSPGSNEARWDEACLRLADAPLPPTPTRTPEPRPTRELAAGAPSPTPELATLEAQARAQAAATLRAIDLQLRATQWAATPPAARSLQAEAALPGTAGLPAGSASLAPVAEGPTRAPLWALIWDRSGLAMLAMAALVAGILAGLGRPR